MFWLLSCRTGWLIGMTTLILIHLPAACSVKSLNLNIHNLNQRWTSWVPLIWSMCSGFPFWPFPELERIKRSEFTLSRASEHVTELQVFCCSDCIMTCWCRRTMNLQSLWIYVKSGEPSAAVPHPLWSLLLRRVHSSAKVACLHCSSVSTIPVLSEPASKAWNLTPCLFFWTKPYCASLCGNRQKQGLRNNSFPSFSCVNAAHAGSTNEGMEHKNTWTK